MRPIRGRGQYSTRLEKEGTVRGEKEKENKDPDEVVFLGEGPSKAKCLGYRVRRLSEESSEEENYLELAFLSCSPPGRPPITFLPGSPVPGSSLDTSLGNILSNIQAGGESTSDPQKMELSEDGSGIDKRVWMTEA